MAFTLRSASFEHDGAIPAKHTCQGDDTAPPLAWAGALALAGAWCLKMQRPSVVSRDTAAPAAPLVVPVDDAPDVIAKYLHEHSRRTAG